MASIPTQEEILAATRKSQEAMIAAIRTWFETVRTATPKLTSVYAPLTERLPKLPASLPFADKLPTPEEAVDNAYYLAEQLLASQRKFAEDLLKAMTPLIPGRSEAAPEGNGSSEPRVPRREVWQEAIAASEPKPVAASQAKPTAAISEPKPVVASEPKPVAASQAKPTAAVSEAKPTATEAKPTPVSEPIVAASAEPKAAARTAVKSTPSRTAPGTTAARSTAAKNAPAKSGAAKNTAETSTPKRTSASRAPKDTDAH
jgi:outer membrane biosynthesis protein TonB